MGFLLDQIARYAGTEPVLLATFEVAGTIDPGGGSLLALKSNLEAAKSDKASRDAALTAMGVAIPASWFELSEPPGDDPYAEPLSPIGDEELRFLKEVASQCEDRLLEQVNFDEFDEYEDDVAMDVVAHVLAGALTVKPVDLAAIASSYLNRSVTEDKGGGMLQFSMSEHEARKQNDRMFRRLGR